MRILIVDDEPLALERLRMALATIPAVEIVGAAEDGVEAAQAIADHAPDLVLLDIQMPGMSGLELAQALVAAERRPEVIFVTAFNRFAVDAFGVEAVDYLLKPVSFDRLRIAIERVRRRRAQRDAEGRAAELDAVVNALRSEAVDAPALMPTGGYDGGIWVPGRHGAVRVPVDTIDWIEAARDYVLLNTPTKSHILRSKMSDLEGRLDPRVMLRIHRSYIIRLGAVGGVERPGKGALRVILKEGTALQVGPSYMEQTNRALRL